MAWENVEQTIRETAESVCTPKQLEALRLAEDGLGYNRIALQLRISPSSARDRIRRGMLAIELALERAA